MTATLGIVSSVTAVTAVLVHVLKQPRNLPPGPKPLPLFGNLRELNKDPRFYLAIHELRKKYGEIMTLYFGPQRMIVISSHDLLRDAFVRQTQVTSDRPYLLEMEIFSDHGQDIVQADLSPRMLMQRKLAHQALRKFSAGGGLAKYVGQAFDAMCEKLDKDPELNTTDMGFLVAYNILLSMCFGKKFSFEDDFFREMVELTKKQDELFTEVSLSDVLPIAQHLPLSKGIQLFKEVVDKLADYIEETLEEHKKNFSKDNVTDFTYQLLNVMEEVDNDPNERSNMKLLTKTHYVRLLMDLFFAGTDTTRMTLSWIWHFLAAYPEVQKKAQNEVDEVLGHDGEVTADSRDRLPYVDAVLHEVMRISTVAPLGLSHKTRTDIKLGGYDIPAGTTLMANTWSIHLDSQYWSDPEAFLPERWLDESGNYQYQQNGFVPFSMGRRSCVGESFVKVELHMLITLMLQKFTITSTPGYTVSLKPIQSQVVVPEDQKPLIARRR